RHIWCIYAPRSTVLSESYFIFFFFSSRRRHTRSKRDWSSDVCSSDLSEGGTVLPNPRGTAPGLWIEDARGRFVILLPGVPHEMRSEERRVGKECRTGWWRAW